MARELAVGGLIGGRYRLDAHLGEGGMGSVWAATHTVTRRRYALKFLKGPAAGREDLRRRFGREARAASAVDHPNVVGIVDLFDLEDGTPVMVMDLLSGRTLGAYLRERGQLSLEEIAALLVPAVSAVGAAHAIGIVHRDLKPDNIFLVESDGGPPEVRVLDFGIAKLTDNEAAIGETGTITGTGAMLGTPCYMSPEQGFGERNIDHRADVWAFGVILYEALAGARPVEGENLGQVLKRLVSDGIMPIAAIVPEVPSDVGTLIDRMLARERDERPEDLRDVLDVLEGHCDTRAPKFGPPSSRSEPALSDPAGASEPIVVGGDQLDPSGETARDTSTPGPDTAAATSISVAGKRKANRPLLWAGAGALGIAAIAAWGLGGRPSGADGSAASATVPATPSVATQADDTARSERDEPAAPAARANMSPEPDAGARSASPQSARAAPAPAPASSTRPSRPARHTKREPPASKRTARPPRTRRRKPPQPNPTEPSAKPGEKSVRSPYLDGLVDDPPF